MKKPVSIIEKLVAENLGGVLEATAVCNQCSEGIRINLVAGASSVSREKLVKTVRPDISLLDENGEPVRFIEVVDSHAPEGIVHEQALRDGTEVVEIHLRADRKFTGRRRNKALDASLTVKARLQELAAGRIVLDADNCTGCDQIQGNWFLYMDPFHDRFILHKAERQEYGPCDRCATRYCMTHGEYMDYRGGSLCPSCLEEAERVMCRNSPDRECFYPQRCDENGCYFLNLEQGRREQLEQAEQQQRMNQEHREQLRSQRKGRYEHEKRQWIELQEWFDQRREAR